MYKFLLNYVYFLKERGSQDRENTFLSRKTKTILFHFKNKTIYFENSKISLSVYRFIVLFTGLDIFNILV